MSDDPDAVRLAREWIEEYQSNLDVQELSNVLARAVLAQHEELERLRNRLLFVDSHAFAALQTAWGPLDELRQKMLWEIRKAARGDLPSWWNANARTLDEAFDSFADSPDTRK